MNNVQAKKSYRIYIIKQLKDQKIWEKITVLHDKALKNIFTDEDEDDLNALDTQITDIFLKGELNVLRTIRDGIHGPQHS